MLTDRETELRDAYLKGYEDKTNYSDKLVVDRYELAERYAVNQAKNNEVLDLVIDCCKQIDNLMLTTKWGIRICKECGSLVNTTGR